MKLIDIKELEVVLKDAKSSKIKLFHKLIFYEDNDRNNRKRLRKFSGFEVKTKFSVSELITVCNLININNESTTDEIITRIVSCFCDFNISEENILHEESELLVGLQKIMIVIKLFLKIFLMNLVYNSSTILVIKKEKHINFLFLNFVKQLLNFLILRT